MTSLFDIYRRSFAEFADRTAVVCGAVELTYAQLGAQVDAFAAALRRRGLAPGSKVALLYPSEPDFFVAFLAVQQLGAVACPLNIESSDAEHFQLLELMDPDVVIVSPRADACYQAVKRVWAGPLATATAFLDEGADLPIAARAPDAAVDDVAIILCTSGTTGLPKAAMLTHDNIVLNLEAFRDHLASFPGRAWLPYEVFGNPIPISHPYGLIMMTLMPLFLGGVTVQIPRFSPASCLQTIDERRITVYGGVPSMYAMLSRFRRKDKYDVSSCRLWISGGAPLPAAVGDEFAKQFGAHICEGFGMLETSSLASLNFETPLVHSASVGPFHAQMRAEIRDDDGRVLSTNETGELWLAGPNIMKGYYRNPEATGEALHDGWLKTGDLGFFDEDGHLYLRGRSKELVIVSGHNVYPREVENVLLEHELVADAAAAAESDPLRGERLLAFVVVADDHAVDEQELLQHCRGRLSPYKAPRAIHFVPSIPRNAAGKIVRRQLLEDLAAARQQENTAELGV